MPGPCIQTAAYARSASVSDRSVRCHFEDESGLIETAAGTPVERRQDSLRKADVFYRYAQERLLRSRSPNDSIASLYCSVYSM